MWHREIALLKNQFLRFIDLAPVDWLDMSFTHAHIVDGHTVINYKLTMPDSGRMFCIPNACHDMVCFATGSDICLCNPITTQVRILPISISMDEPSNPVVDQMLGFGYIVSKRQYVAVNLTRRVSIQDEDGYIDYSGGEVLCEIFTFRANQINDAIAGLCWRASKNSCPRWVGHAESGFVVGSTMCWLIEDGGTNFVYEETGHLFLKDYARRDNELILGLDFETEKFEIIHPPPGWETNTGKLWDVWINLVDIKGTLCVTDVSRDLCFGDLGTKG
ncbi:OLC1v1028199C1 [Oldenlandia corymbosa var. corymbosa]|uniref:OLC1v1028199C1 n=1 Tax=Oldenlandia corymbosa var. corymbosa TaxID=529605 RepID=A0AAV1CBT2_OLDCO|nr:OLC1v1028199C1 [Oldenlandia corymbosa var. corymbosa]